MLDWKFAPVAWLDRSSRATFQRKWGRIGKLRSTMRMRGIVTSPPRLVNRPAPVGSGRGVRSRRSHDVEGAGRARARAARGEGSEPGQLADRAQVTQGYVAVIEASSGCHHAPSSPESPKALGVTEKRLMEQNARWRTT